MALDLSGLIFAFTAGVFSLLSPCGFPMLPGYISYYVGSKTSLRKAVPDGVACTLGLITVFSIIGAIASILGSVINPYITILELVAGIVTIFLGISMLTEIKLPRFSVSLKAPEQKGVTGIFFYGALYGLAALGCSAPIFFAVLFWAIAGGGLLNGIVTFIVYAVGMGLPLILTTVLVAMAKEIALKRIVEMLPLLQKISGLILIIIGIYLIYFYYSFYYVF